MSEVYEPDVCGGAVVASYATTGVWPARMPTCKDRLQVHRGFDVSWRVAGLVKAETEHKEERAKFVDDAAKAKGKKP